jgi:hypothetical protein
MHRKVRDMRARVQACKCKNPCTEVLAQVGLCVPKLSRTRWHATHASTQESAFSLVHSRPHSTLMPACPYVYPFDRPLVGKPRQRVQLLLLIYLLRNKDFPRMMPDSFLLFLDYPRAHRIHTRRANSLLPQMPLQIMSRMTTKYILPLTRSRFAPTLTYGPLKLRSLFWQTPHLDALPAAVAA